MRKRMAVSVAILSVTMKLAACGSTAAGPDVEKIKVESEAVSSTADIKVFAPHARLNQPPVPKMISSISHWTTSIQPFLIVWISMLCMDHLMSVSQMLCQIKMSLSLTLLNRPGVFMYPCATAPVLEHIANGIHGTIIVKPKNGYPTDNEVDRESYASC